MLYVRNTAAAAAAACALLPQTLAQAEGPYEPTWDSTDKHNAAPEWFRDAKFGVYWHWGAFTTPQYGSEWYGRNMYIADSNEHDHHTRTYGPPEEWGYDRFITGGKDLQGNDVQFKSVLASEGGEFDPATWMRVIKASGARFAGPVAEHHDGFSMWDSEVNEWNSVDLGPKIDLVKLFADLVRENDMKLVIAMHQAFNVNGFFAHAPQQDDPSLRRLLGQVSREEGDKRWLEKQLEVLDHVQPDMIWNDFALDSPGYCQGDSDHCSIGEDERLTFLAHYFNRGVEWDKDVLTTYKHFDDGFHDTSAVADWERGGPAELTRPYWQTDEAISATSWSYTEGISYYSIQSMLHSLLDRVSKNGNMLLNISPTAVGVIPQEQEDVLRAIGDYLGRYGESVYGTRAWDIYGEGPNRAGGGSFTAPLVGNSSDIRFTRNKEDSVLYAAVLGWPEDRKVLIQNLGSDALVSLESLQSVQLLGDEAGQYASAEWEQTNEALDITLPAQPAESWAYVLKLTFEQRIPVPQPKAGASIFSASEAQGDGVTLGLGDFKRIFMTEAGLAPKKIRSIRVSPGSKATLFANGDLTGASTELGSGEHKVEACSVGSIRIESA
ncbi:alpha-L-fucosidase-domain-containing protein [Emericellopsis atlantica]|uniref:alpha-L-fucosidase n=1 Tax=Emericellopsis atlantica TaxID=2614577 RepID=A0A9P8CRY9_9HYPO|nr:alpha-L-fucosidase-domain-containing protein [Emericellopsis atlantica]KAG9256842.1 alpha-L-fucosidase-domain-containing protein [Emericellopsis atlantica]